MFMVRGFRFALHVDEASLVLYYCIPRLLKFVYEYLLILVATFKLTLLPLNRRMFAFARF